MVGILVVLVAVVGLVSPAAVERVSLGVVGDQAEPGHDDGGAHREGGHHHEHLNNRRRRMDLKSSVVYL